MANPEVELTFAKRELMGVGLITLGSPNVTSPGFLLPAGMVKTQSGVSTVFVFDFEH